ncbi:MAG: rhodanese-like domain-containing protein [Polyangiales bacterium]
MTKQLTAAEVRSAFATRRELALIDLRSEARYAAAHPLFASQFTIEQLLRDAEERLPRRDVPVVLYDDGEGQASDAAAQLTKLGYTEVHVLANDLAGWRAAGFELFQDVNSYSKAFGELVESRRHTPSLSAPELLALIDQRADIAVLDARRYDEYNTMSIPTGTSVPGAELVLRARAIAPDPSTTVVVNCAGRTRSIIGAQSLINAGLPNKVLALRNGTIGWTLAGQSLETGQTRRAPLAAAEITREAQTRARAVSYRAGVRRIDPSELAALTRDTRRTLYRFDVRTPEEYAAGHVPDFTSTPGGQLVQETDMVAPVRGARIVLADDLYARADMTASWLAQMGWEVYVLQGGDYNDRKPQTPRPRPTTGRYKRPYEGTDNPTAAMQAYLEWEYGLVAQLERDGSHGFFVI